ncbi:unnamed protein product [Rhodiola kirilowii]
MVKGEDSIRRKKNKATRKKLSRKESVSARVAAIIATKKRRKAGKRRISEGMCFGLPTPDDPFRDRYRGKKDTDFVDDDVLTARAKRHLKKILKDGDDDAEKNNHEHKKKVVKADNHVDKKSLGKKGKVKPVGNDELGHANGQQKKTKISSIRPSKVLLLCLNTIQSALQNDCVSDGEGDKDMPFFASGWGIEFLKYYSSGNDVLLVGGSCPSANQIAWIVSAAADSIQNMESGGHSTPSPFLLYIVPSQNRACEVRTVCKPLKGVGLHTVSVHPGVSVERQIHGLKSCEPEFVVSTPERLLELVSLKAIDISTVSLMVVDKLDPESEESHLEAIKSIKQCITGKPITVICDGDQSSSGSDGRSLLGESFCTLSLTGHVTIEKIHTNHTNNKSMKRPSKKEKIYKDKKSCHCCH